MSEQFVPPWVHNSIVFNISREMALDYGIVEPTPEEAAEREESLRRYEARRLESWAIYDRARPDLAAIHDPVARKVLDLHHTNTVEAPKCEGCDLDGYEVETPEWPCRTVQAIAEHYGITMPEPGDLWRRPTPPAQTATEETR